MKDVLRGSQIFRKRTDTIINFIFWFLFSSAILFACVYICVIYFKTDPKIFTDFENFFAVFEKNSDWFYNKAPKISALIALPISVFSLVCFYFFGFFLKKDAYKRGRPMRQIRQFKKELKKHIRSEIKEIDKDSYTNLSTKKLFKEMTWDPVFVSGGTLSYSKFLKLLRIPPPQWFQKLQKKFEIPIYPYMENRHILFAGMTGSGKTTLIDTFIDKNRKRGELGLVIDINGEAHSKHGKPGDIILSLYDKRASFWDHTHENGGNLKGMNLASYVVPDNPHTDPVWVKGPRAVLEHLFSHYTMEEIWEEIEEKSSEEFYLSLPNYVKKIIGAPGTGQESGIITSTINQLACLAKLNYWPKKMGHTEPFSLYDWTHSQDSRWVWIIVRDQDIVETELLLNMWMNIAMLGILERPAYNTLPKVNIYCDELGSFPKIESLRKFLERGRKYGGQLKVGVQSHGTFKEKYGASAAESILTNFGTTFIFRTSNPDNGEFWSRYLGDREVVRKVVSESFGGRSAKPKDRESGVNIQYTHVCVQNVSLGEIQSLRDGYYFLSSFSLPPVKARVWKQRWPVVNRTHEEEYGSINLEEKKSRLNGASQFEETSQTHRLDKGTHLGKEF